MEEDDEQNYKKYCPSKWIKVDNLDNEILSHG
jgi:hypothetical protein